MSAVEAVSGTSVESLAAALAEECSLSPGRVVELLEAEQADQGCGHPASMWDRCHACVTRKVRWAVRVELAAERETWVAAVVDRLVGQAEPQLSQGRVVLAPLLTVDQVAELLAVGTSKIYQLVAAGELVPIEGLDRPKRFSVEAVAEFVDRRDPVGARRRRRDRKRPGRSPAGVTAIREAASAAHVGGTKAGRTVQGGETA